MLQDDNAVLRHKHHRRCQLNTHTKTKTTAKQTKTGKPPPETRTHLVHKLVNNVPEPLIGQLQRNGLLRI